jgi:prepilin-type processing-associated H-X9-DG protein
MACLAKQKSLGFANAQYANDNNSYLPLAAYDPDGAGAFAQVAWPANTRTSGASMPLNQDNAYYDYLQLDAIRNAFGVVLQGDPFGPFMCPTYLRDGIKPYRHIDQDNLLQVSYSYNMYVGASISAVYPAWYRTPVKLENVVKASEKALMVDGVYRNTTKVYYAVDGTFAAPGTAVGNSPMDRHIGKNNNLLYFDGHAATRTGDVIYNGGGAANQTFWNTLTK